MRVEYPYLKNKTILIADEEEMLRELIVMELKKYGVTCVEANDGVEAYDLIEHNHIDFIVSDIRMPGGSGIDLLRKLKVSSEHSKLPIILMSGFTDLCLDLAKELGAITIVAKPFIFREILPIINEVLSRDKNQKAS